MPVLNSPGRTARRRQPPILSEPTSWHDRNRVEPDPVRAASRPEGMIATAPESAFGNPSAGRCVYPGLTVHQAGAVAGARPGGGPAAPPGPAGRPPPPP